MAFPTPARALQKYTPENRVFWNDHQPRGTTFDVLLGNWSLLGCRVSIESRSIAH